MEIEINLGFSGAFGRRQLLGRPLDREFRPEQPDHDSVFFLVQEGQSMRTTFAKPVMPYTVDSAWRISRCGALIWYDGIGSKTEKLTAAGPMKGRRTCGVGAFGMKLLVERSRRHRCAAGGRRVAAGIVNSHSFLFQALDRGPQPRLHCFFDLILVAVAIERSQRFTG